MPAKRGTAKRGATKRTAAKRGATKRGTATKSTAKRSTAKKATGKKTAKKAVATRSATKKTTAKKTGAKKSAAAGRYTNPTLRERLKRRIMRGSKGGEPGQWSARKAQLLAHEYEAQGGGYSGRKTASQRHIATWDDDA